MSKKSGIPSPTRGLAVDKPVRGIDWTEIFKRRPELEPPGYKEVVQSIRKSNLNDSKESA